MKRKIISIYSHITLVASTIAAPYLALYDLKFLPTCLWVAAVFAATVGMFYVLNVENENAPKERQLSQGHSKKFYNFNLSERSVVVNED